MDFITQNMGYLITAAIVIAALILVMMIVSFIGKKVHGRHGSRLSVSEYHEIDNDRRLVLVRRDDREHLLLIGGSQDIVIEQGIEAEPDIAAPRAPRAAPRREQGRNDDTEDRRPIPLRPPQRPVVFGERGPVLRPVGRDEPRLGTVPPASEKDES